MQLEDIEHNAEKAADFLKGLANPHRLIILCKLTEGERSVTELITLTGIAQTSMSQHLSRLKEEQIVTFRRDHRTLYYRIENEIVMEFMQIMYKHFCQQETPE